MKRKAGKYIVYIDNDYLCDLYEQRGIYTEEEKYKLQIEILENIKSFLKGETKVLICSPMYTNDKGKRVKCIEISPVLSSGNPKTLNYIRKLNRKQ